MVRRTKEDALATRDSILDAAELLFVEQGVSGTTLQHIATAAGVTRGAIYWHFEDKGALFNAMMDRARMPLEGAMDAFNPELAHDPLGELRGFATRVFALTIDDPKARRVFEIATLKMEFVGEMSAVRARKKLLRDEWMRNAERVIRAGVQAGHLAPVAQPPAIALGLYVLIEGLVRNWLIEPDFDLVALGGDIVDTHLQALRAA